jgi:LPXTG-motif cell wall-anchored protein
MIRWITFGSVWCVLMASPADLFAQVNSYGRGFDPYAPGIDPRVRRAWREKAVAAFPNAREFVETHGEEAASAILACSRPVAVKLVEFYSSGEMGKLPQPRALLAVIARPRHGDDVALFAIHHVGELSDSDSFTAYLSRPLEYALGLKPLAAGAAEARARRLTPAAIKTPPSAGLSANEKLAIVGAAGLAIAGFLIWRRKRSSRIC